MIARGTRSSLCYTPRAPNVPTQGWTDEALAAGARDMGLSIASVGAAAAHLAPPGPQDRLPAALPSLTTGGGCRRPSAARRSRPPRTRRTRRVLQRPVRQAAFRALPAGLRRAAGCAVLPTPRQSAAAAAGSAAPTATDALATPLAPCRPPPEGAARGARPRPPRARRAAAQGLRPRAQPAGAPRRRHPPLRRPPNPLLASRPPPSNPRRPPSLAPQALLAANPRPRPPLTQPSAPAPADSPVQPPLVPPPARRARGRAVPPRRGRLLGHELVLQARRARRGLLRDGGFPRQRCGPRSPACAGVAVACAVCALRSSSPPRVRGLAQLTPRAARPNADASEDLSATWAFLRESLEAMDDAKKRLRFVQEARRPPAHERPGPPPLRARIPAYLRRRCCELSSHG